MAGRVLYAGLPGTFAEEFCREHIPDRKAHGVADFAAVIAAVAQDRSAIGVVPLRNSRAGEVDGMADLLASAPVRVAASHWHPVRMHCLALPGTELNSIDTIASHPMALRQCRAFLSRHDWQQRETADTASAADLVKQSGARRMAALASRSAAQAHSLTILVEDVHDDPDNRTEFAIVERV